MTPINKFMYDETFLSYEYKKEMNQFSIKYCYPEDLVFHKEYDTSLDLLSKWSQQHNSVTYDTIQWITFPPWSNTKIIGEGNISEEDCDLNLRWFKTVLSLYAGGCYTYNWDTGRNVYLHLSYASLQFSMLVQTQLEIKANADAN